MTSISSVFAAMALLGSTAVTVPASAAPLLYSFTPTSPGAQSFTFNVDSQPVPLASAPFQFTARVQNFTSNGVARNVITNFDFYTPLNLGGLFSLNIGSFSGPQLFSGTTSAPILLAGRFTLSDGPFGSSGILDVTSVAAAVPEPGSWAMMIVGVGLAGSVIRRRKVITRVSYAV